MTSEEEIKVLKEKIELLERIAELQKAIQNPIIHIYSPPTYPYPSPSPWVSCTTWSSVAT